MKPCKDCLEKLSKGQGCIDFCEECKKKLSGEIKAVNEGLKK